MAQDARAILSEMIERNCAVMVSLPSAAMTREYKARFLAQCDDGIWVESSPTYRTLTDDLIASKEPVQIGFNHAQKQIQFCSAVLKRDEHYRINAEQTIDAMLVAHPADFKSVQRRNDYRASVPRDFGIVVNVWRIPEQADINAKPMAAQQMLVMLRDLSVGGMGVIVSKKQDEPVVRAISGERLRVELKHNDTVLLIEGRLRFPGSADVDHVRAGIQFANLSTDIKGRQILATLTKLVGELQREELRRQRLGLRESA